jgi:hypothetical protein
LADTIELLARLLEEGGVVEDRRAAKKESVAAWATPWVRIAGNPVKLTMLLEIATAINISNSGFFSLMDSHALAAKGYKDSGVRYPFDKKPAVLLDCLLRYLPVISVSVMEDATIMSLCARPAQSEGFICQFATLASQLQEKLQEIRNKARELPMKKYLQFLGHEKKKGVLKGLMAQLTTPEFVERKFGWRKESIARITEELNGMNQFLSGLDNLYHTVGAASAYQRRKQIAVAQAALKVTGFMLRKGSHGGRPSLLLQFSCCLGGVVEGLLEELNYGGKADRRRQDAALHRGGHASLDVV